MKRRRIAELRAICLALTFVTAIAGQGLPDDALLRRVREYIKKSWTTLSRSNQRLAEGIARSEDAAPAWPAMAALHRTG